MAATMLARSVRSDTRSATAPVMSGVVVVGTGLVIVGAVVVDAIATVATGDGGECVASTRTTVGPSSIHPTNTNGSNAKATIDSPGDLAFKRLKIRRYAADR